MTEHDRVSRRRLFDEVAELYDRVRPSYPVAVYTDLAELAGVRPGARVLEIGCGTGQLTVPLARLGCQVTAVELGSRLAAMARRNLAGLPAEVVVADIERWQPGDRPFDVVLAATAFHWLDPKTRVGRMAALLRPGGTLATISTSHLAGGTASFFRAAQRCYRRWDPDATEDFELPTAAQIPFDRDIDHCGLFGQPSFRRYEWECQYSTAGYLDLLRTYSGTLAMRPNARAKLLACIGGLIDDQHHGVIVKRYLTELRILRRTELPQPPTP